MTRSGLRAIAALLALASAASAQTPPPASQPSTTVSGVTVQGQEKAAPTFHDRFVQSLNFISSRGQPAHLGQLARWASPVCPVTLGLSPEMNALVSERVKALDFKVGAPQARRPGRCKPNIEILFTDKPQALLDLVARKRNALLGFHYVAQLRAVTRVTRPIQAWYLTETVGGGGGASLDAPGPVGRAASLDVEFSQSPGGCAGSAFTECLSSDLVNVLVVADGNALAHSQIGPVADYIALIALAQFRTIDTCDALPTLLDMFTPACADRPAVDAPGAQDIGYLKALYNGNNALKVWMQKSLVAERMARGSAGAPKP
jgi:hypothetical protein